MTEPLTRAEQKQQTRDAIMTAAVRKMNDDRGFSSLSLREVAKEAGIAPPSFYRHFDNMEALALALVKEAGDALLKIASDTRVQEEKGENVLEGTVAVCMEHFRQNGPLFRVLAREATGNSPIIRRAIQRVLNDLNKQLAKVIELEMKKRGRKITDAAWIAEAIITLVFYIGVSNSDLPYARQKDAEKRLVHHIRALYWGAEAMASSLHLERQLMLY
ncbi:MAG TPA: HTH-type transcriptional repressor FabR [Dongiaceae bacterium]|nr:HTH-type transcriptional repressor FabR [Dongiaceae bacterium]